MPMCRTVELVIFFFFSHSFFTLFSAIFSLLGDEKTVRVEIHIINSIKNNQPLHILYYSVGVFSYWYLRR